MAFSTTVAIFIGIVLAQILPFRQRPRANPDVVGSNAANSQFFEEWSSMPSDHAVMFFAIATGFFLVSRMAGAFAFLHAMFVVCLPRVLIGFHFASDIVVGAMIGMTASILVTPLFFRLLANSRLVRSMPENILYPFVFLITFSFGTMFNSVRAFGEIVKMIIKAVL